VTALSQTRSIAGFRRIAAVGKSIEMVLNAAYAATEPVDTDPTHAVLIQTDDLDLTTSSPPRRATRSPTCNPFREAQVGRAWSHS